MAKKKAKMKGVVHRAPALLDEEKVAQTWSSADAAVSALRALHRLETRAVILLASETLQRDDVAQRCVAQLSNPGGSFREDLLNLGLGYHQMFLAGRNSAVVEALRLATPDVAELRWRRSSGRPILPALSFFDAAFINVEESVLIAFGEHFSRLQEDRLSDIEEVDGLVIRPNLCSEDLDGPYRQAARRMVSEIHPAAPEVDTIEWHGWLTAGLQVIKEAERATGEARALQYRDPELEREFASKKDRNSAIVRARKEGQQYQDIAIKVGVEPGTLRTIVSRENGPASSQERPE